MIANTPAAHGFARAAACFLFLLLLATANPLPQTEKPDIRVLRDEHGAVTSQSAECSRIGIDVMKDGGNAVDAVRWTPASILLFPLLCAICPAVAD